MVDEPSLADLLVCPVCGGELGLADMRRHSSGACRQCLRSFRYDDGVFDLTPVPPPDATVAARWSIWQKLQENGSIAYEQCPEQNLSIGTREDAQAFAAFCGLEGLVLDVGCGPQSMPSYGLNFDGRLIGIDPLRGRQPKSFDFVRGVGEFLPFAQATFHRVLFATSLDHC